MKVKDRIYSNFALIFQLSQSLYLMLGWKFSHWALKSQHAKGGVLGDWGGMPCFCAAGQSSNADTVSTTAVSVLLGFGQNSIHVHAPSLFSVTNLSYLQEYTSVIAIVSMVPSAFIPVFLLSLIECCMCTRACVCVRIFLFVCLFFAKCLIDL